MMDVHRPSNPATWTRVELQREIAEGYVRVAPPTVDKPEKAEAHSASGATAGD